MPSSMCVSQSIPERLRKLERRSVREALVGARVTAIGPLLGDHSLNILSPTCSPYVLWLLCNEANRPSLSPTCHVSVNKEGKDVCQNVHDDRNMQHSSVKIKISLETDFYEGEFIYVFWLTISLPSLWGRSASLFLFFTRNATRFTSTLHHKNCMKHKLMNAQELKPNKMLLIDKKYNIHNTYLQFSQKKTTHIIYNLFMQIKLQKLFYFYIVGVVVYIRGVSHVIKSMMDLKMQPILHFQKQFLQFKCILTSNFFVINVSCDKINISKAIIHSKSQNKDLFGFCPKLYFKIYNNNINLENVLWVAFSTPSDSLKHVRHTAHKKIVYVVCYDLYETEDFESKVKTLVSDSKF